MLINNNELSKFQKLFFKILLEHSHYLQYYDNHKYYNITYKHNVLIKPYNTLLTISLHNLQY